MRHETGMTHRTARLPAPPGRARRLRYHRNSRGELWVNVTSSHLVLPDYVNLDPAFSPGLVAAYPALRRTSDLTRLLRASRTLRLLRRGCAAGWRSARRPRLAAVVARLAPRSSPRPRPRWRRRDLPAGPRGGRGWTIREQWEAREVAVVARHDPRAALPLDDDSVDHLLCAHVLQELPPPAMRRALEEYARVLRPGGTLHVVLPDLRYAVDRYVRGEIDADELVAWQRLRSPGEERGAGRLGLPRRGNARHPTSPVNRWHYDAHTAERRLVGAGFKIASGTSASGTSPSSPVYREDPGSLHLVAVRA
ncbi:class I SAM-dependent methyltransferase [Parafrankia sp. EAN1pec]|uniref:class I SAM-dependent methyltransferase n=1 Tax=Parafrankia sp. (strain EAN1pec) TaxID=298653 RepID=UPI003219257A